jgi:hypothetical protein
MNGEFDLDKEKIKIIVQSMNEEIKDNLSYKNHIKEMNDIFLKLKNILNNLDINNSENLPYTIQKTQVIVLTNLLTEILESIILLQKSNLFLPSDPLSRVALERSINILYILKSDDHKHSKQFMKNYIDTMHKASKHWYDYEVKQNREYGIQTSKEKVEYFEALKKGYSKLYDDSCGNWPRVKERFEVCGHESAYKTLYSMNSDSIHSSSEDVYEYCLINAYPYELQEIAVERFKSIQVSMSVYHGIKSLQYYGHVIEELSRKTRNKSTEKPIKKVMKQIIELVYQHENDKIKSDERRRKFASENE